MNRSCRYQAVVLLALAGFISATVVKEELTLTWETGAPNGQPREMIRMNGQFPGPTFVWDEDDDVEDAGYAVVRWCPGPYAEAHRSESVVHLSLQSITARDALVSEPESSPGAPTTAPAYHG
ncbi:unnamed protein product [Penicillium viridicatum]